MTYQDALSYLYEQLPMFHRIGKAAYKADLSTTIELCRLSGNPQLSFPSIHIAGTNGKGSVSNMIASILQEAGYKTGLFTSPHLIDFRERIRINGKMIAKDKVVQFLTTNQKKFQGLKPSFFEWTFGLGMHHFAHENIDIAVVETGMGGRLDSTNTINSVLSIITNIGLDHMAFLGNTPGEIAVEKAGIIKPEIPVVIGETQKDISGIFIKIAKNNKSPIIFADRNIQLKKLISPHRQIDSFDLEARMKKGDKPLKLKTSLSGNYQLKNIRTVLASIKVIHESGFKITDNNIINGILQVKENTGFMGRWEIISAKPIIIADTAHNPDGIRMIVKQLRQLPAKNKHMVIGFVNDKDISKILNMLPKKWEYYFCQPDIPRGLSTEVLQQEALKAGIKGISCSSVMSAFNMAKSIAGIDDLIYVGGSTFVVAEFFEKMAR